MMFKQESVKQELLTLRAQADYALTKYNEIVTRIWVINQKMAQLSKDKENLKTNDSKENIDSILFEGEIEKKIVALSEEKETLQTRLKANCSKKNIDRKLSEIKKIEKNLDGRFNVNSPYSLKG